MHCSSVIIAVSHVVWLSNSDEIVVVVVDCVSQLITWLERQESKGRDDAATATLPLPSFDCEMTFTTSITGKRGRVGETERKERREKESEIGGGERGGRRHLARS